MKKWIAILLVMVLAVASAACGTQQPATVETTPPATEAPSTTAPEAEPTEAATEEAVTTEPATEATTEPATEPPTEAPTQAPTVPVTDPPKTDEGIDPEFKAAMDSYEKFFDEYVEIMNKYAENPADISILTDYVSYMGQYADMMQKLEEWENKDLNAAELAYYLEVITRINEKLLGVL